MYNELHVWNMILNVTYLVFVCHIAFLGLIILHPPHTSFKTHLSTQLNNGQVRRYVAGSYRTGYILQFDILWTYLPQTSIIILIASHSWFILVRPVCYYEVPEDIVISEKNTVTLNENIWFSLSGVASSLLTERIQYLISICTVGVNKEVLQQLRWNIEIIFDLDKPQEFANNNMSRL